MSKLPKSKPLPKNLAFYTPDHLARALVMSACNVRRHLSNLFRQWEGQWRLTYEQALRALKYINQCRYDARRSN